MKSISEKSAIRVNYFFWAFSLGAVIPFFSVYFKDFLEISDSKVGMLLMIRPAVAILVLALWGLIADTMGHRGRLAFFLMVIGACILPFVNLMNNMVLVVILLVMWAFFIAPLNSLCDAIALQYLGPARRNNLASLRIFASLGWITTLLIVGKVLDQLGIQWMFIVYTIGAFIAAIFLWRIPPDQKTTRRQGFAAIKSVLAKRNVILFLSAVFIYEIANQMAIAFLSIYCRSIGATHTQIGWIWALATIAELVTMYYASRVLKKINVKVLISIGMAFAVFRWLPIGFVNIWWMILPFQLMHAFTLTFVFIGTAIFLDMESPKEVRFSTQAFYSTIILESGAIVGAFVGGQISEQWGYTWLYISSGTLAAIATMFLLLFVRVPKRSEG